MGIWRLCDQDFEMKRLQPTMTHTSYSLIVWRANWCHDRSELVGSDGNTNSGKYVSVLQKVLLPIFSSGEMIKEDSLVTEGGAPCHTAKITQDLLDENVIKKLL